MAKAEVYYCTTGSGSVWTEWSLYATCDSDKVEQVVQECMEEYGPQFDGDLRNVMVKVQVGSLIIFDI